MYSEVLPQVINVICTVFAYRNDKKLDMKRISRARAWQVMSLIVLVICLLLIYQWINSSFRKESQFKKAISEGEWSAVYKLHSPDIWERYLISESQFELFMNEICNENVKPKLRSYRSETKTIAPGSSVEKTVSMITFPELVKYDGDPVTIYLQTGKTRFGWVVPIAEFPINLSRAVATSKEESYLLLLNAMEKSRIENYPVSSDGLVLVRARLSDYFEHGVGSLDTVYARKR